MKALDLEASLSADAKLVLPDPPEQIRDEPVRAWEQAVELLTFAPGEPDVNPMFLENRVYQGSSGAVYPLPVIDHIALVPVVKSWRAFHLENEYLRFMILPDLGGRIHVGLDKRNNYDFFYRQNVIKPALVGLAGPWVSGGVEFNWPQHHRPSTYLPTEVSIELESDGSRTIWCGDIDRLSGLKGMHGLRLQPDSVCLEVKARAYNKTSLTQTFLWWANVAVRVHEHYQSFFPPDVRFVADHAKRAISSFPRSAGTYYGIDYGARQQSGIPSQQRPSQFVPDGSYPSNDLSWYSNIPVPTSYMAVNCTGNFSGGYDHKRRAGLVHVAPHQIAPGKKQWTWGNHAFGYQWDRNLTEADGPYIELMAGFYTDNQPDFSFLAPGETKIFNHRWYPLQEIGPVVEATPYAALSIQRVPHLRMGINVTKDCQNAVIEATFRDGTSVQCQADLTVTRPEWIDFREVVAERSIVSVHISNPLGFELLRYTAAQPENDSTPIPAQEPPSPENVRTIEDLYLIGLHLEQYRHATRNPELYWREALRRDPNDSRTNCAMAKARYRQGLFEAAVEHARISVQRSTKLNSNPADGEGFFVLGLSLEAAGDQQTAYDAFYKATWNAAWRGAGYLAVAKIEARRGNWLAAKEHANFACRMNADDLGSLNLLAIACSRLDEFERSEGLLQRALETDPLDATSSFLLDNRLPEGGFGRLDLVYDLLDIGLFDEAWRVAQAVRGQDDDGSATLLSVARLWLAWKLNSNIDRNELVLLNQMGVRYAFPNRLREYQILRDLAALMPEEWIPNYLLGNWLYAKQRKEEAVQCWELASSFDRSPATCWRNLGLAYFNVKNDSAAALKAYGHAIARDPHDARLIFEQDQLWKRLNYRTDERLNVLLRERWAIDRRDDLAVEAASLLCDADRPQEALDLLMQRSFQVWEGGEGLVLEQYVTANLRLAQYALLQRDFDRARAHLRQTLDPPPSLGETHHPLANRAEIYFWMGLAFLLVDMPDQAVDWFRRAADDRSNFVSMRVEEHSPAIFWSGAALRLLDRDLEATQLFQDLLAFAEQQETRIPEMDYFATSLPDLILFKSDVSIRHQGHISWIKLEAFYGLRRKSNAATLITKHSTEAATQVGLRRFLRSIESVERLLGRDL